MRTQSQEVALHPELTEEFLNVPRRRVLFVYKQLKVSVSPQPAWRAPCQLTPGVSKALTATLSTRGALTPRPCIYVAQLHPHPRAPGSLIVRATVELLYPASTRGTT